MRLRLIAAVAAVAALAPASIARAGEFDVHICDANYGGGANNALVSSAYNPDYAYMEAHAFCDGGTQVVFGGPIAGAWTVPYGRVAMGKVTAPAGTTVSGIRWSGTLRGETGQWQTGVSTGGQYIFWTQGTTQQSAVFADVPLSQSVDFETICIRPTGCDGSVAASDPRAAVYYVNNISVRIRDNDQPSLSFLNSPPGWTNSPYLELAATDATGVQDITASVAGQTVAHWTNNCDYTQLIPCGQAPLGGEQSFSAPEGSQTLTVDIRDAAGNVRHETRPLLVDTVASAAPHDVTISGQDAWSQSPTHSVRWADPVASGAPVIMATEHSCKVGGGCRDTDHYLSSQNGYDGVSAWDGPGSYQVSWTFVDAANNRSAASNVVTLRYDPSTPGKADLSAANGWVNATDAAAYHVPLRLGRSEPVPVSGIAGYSVTTDGSDPDSSVEAVGREPLYTLPAPLPEGDTIIKARAISGSGVASPSVDSTVVHVDATAPGVRLEGASDPDTWHREPVTLSVSGNDSLSGMTAAPAGHSLSEGGYVGYRLDGADPVNSPGDHAPIPLDTDGVHALAAYAVDVAGNRSSDQTTVVKIDRTAPETIVFAPASTDDPTILRVDVSDAVSGVADGQIEMRRADRDGAWTILPTTLADGELVAKIPDETLEDGSYALRASATDRAGNERTSDQTATGAHASLALPLRARAALTVSTKTTSARVCRTLKTKNGTRKKCEVARVPIRSGKKVTVKLKPVTRKLTTIYGQLATPQGAPLAGAAVIVTEQPRNRGSIRQLSTLTTNSTGTFSIPLLRGPSRTIRFAYAGSAHTLPVTTPLSVLTPASSTFKATPRSVGFEGKVRFTGQLQGGWVPPGGELVQLQVFYRGRWTDVTSPVTDLQGRWNASYQFGPNPKAATYKFRINIPRTFGYPFEFGRTAKLAVHVAGHP